MKKAFDKLIVIVISVSFFIGCAETYDTTVEDQLQEIGILGEHQLKDIRRLDRTKGSLKGDFFLGTGDVNGSLGFENKVQLFWEFKPNIVHVIIVPLDKIRFIIEENTVPTIEFVFDDSWLNMTNIRISQEGKENPNLLIGKGYRSHWLLQYTVKLSKEKLRELY